MSRLTIALSILLAIGLACVGDLLLNPRPAGAQINYKQSPNGGIVPYSSSFPFVDAASNNQGVPIGDSAQFLYLPVYPHAFNGSTWDRTGYCSNFVTLTQAASTTAQLVGLSAGKLIRVCSFYVNALNVDTAAFEYGTGSACGTGTTALTGAMNLGAAGTIVVPSGGPGSYTMITPASQELCLVTGAGVGGTTGGLMYGQW